MTLPYLLAGILAVLGQLSDCVTTQIALALGGKEANPLMGSVVAHPLAMYSLKTAIALVCLYVCNKKFGPRKVGVALVLLCAVVGFAAAGWNLVVIRHLLQ